MQCTWTSQSATVCTLLPMNGCEHVQTSKLHFTMERLVGVQVLIWTVLEPALQQHIHKGFPVAPRKYFSCIHQLLWPARSGFCLLSCIIKPAQFPRRSPTIDNFLPLASHLKLQYSSMAYMQRFITDHWPPSATTCLFQSSQSQQQAMLKGVK